MGIPFLSEPINIYKQTYIKALEEFQKEGRNLRYDKSELIKDFDGFIEGLNQLKSNPKFDYGKVKESTYWLIDNSEFIGRISIRHELSSYLEKYDGHIGFEICPSKRRLGYGSLILNLGIKKAKAIGLKWILVMCEDMNLASIRIIEHNKGILLDRYPLKIEGKYRLVRKYIIL